MRRAIKVLASGSFADTAICGSVLLTYDERYRRRIKLTDTAGGTFMLDLEKTRLLQQGEGLVLEDGGVIVVVAADEDVADIHVSSVVTMARIAWHIGNRHTPLQVMENGGLRLRFDAILVQMIEKLGAHVHRVREPFSPEGGAYSSQVAVHVHDGHHQHDH